jgi:hypothetical protein
MHVCNTHLPNKRSLPLPEFSTGDVVKILDIPRERFREWIVRKFIKPSIQAPDGYKSRAIFSLVDVYGAGIFKHLLSKGFNRDRSAKYVEGFVKYEELKEANYILFRQCKNQIDITAFGEGEWSIDLKTGNLKNEHATIVNKYHTKKLSQKTWESIFIINFQLIKKKIDDAILKL